MALEVFENFLLSVQEPPYTYTVIEYLALGFYGQHLYTQLLHMLSDKPYFYQVSLVGTYLQPSYLSLFRISPIALTVTSCKSPSPS